MQNSGNLTDLPVSDILQTVQADRATGTLRVTADAGEATLYFLFGHLFHATSGDRTGEDVVHSALDWDKGSFTFDAKAKLPAEETIKVSTSDILARHKASGGGGAAAQEEEPAAVEPEAEADEPPAAEAEAEEEEEAAPAEAEEEPEAAEEEVAEPEPPAAAGRGGRRRRTDTRPGTRPPETMELYAVPRGKLVYEQLTASFVDFPKVLRSLAKDKHTGYVRLSGEGFSGVLLFGSGSVVEALFQGDDDVLTGQAAFDSFAAHIDAGEGALDVIQLSLEVVTALFQLLTAPSQYERLLARFVKTDALLEYLGETGMSGAVIVRSTGDHGIVLFREGKILGAYTDKRPDVAQKPDSVLALCAAPEAEIEVRGGPVPETLPVMDSGGGRGTPIATGGASKTQAAAAAEEVEDSEPAVETEEPAEEAVAEAGPRAEANGIDWAARIDQMASRADSVLGTRSKKVKELLYSTSHSQEDVEATLDKISELSIMFVDPSKLSALADDMRRIAAE